MQHENIHISTDIIINAPKEKVWKALADVSNWNQWTSLVLSAQGNVGKDENISITFVNPEGGGLTFERTIFHFEEGNAFGWTGEAFAGLKDFHVYELETLADGDTRFIQSDGLHGAEVSGIEAIEQQILAGYQIFNQELKTYVENKL